MDISPPFPGRNPAEPIRDRYRLRAANCRSRVSMLRATAMARSTPAGDRVRRALSSNSAIQRSKCAGAMRRWVCAPMTQPL